MDEEYIKSKLNSELIVRLLLQILQYHIIMI